MLWGLVEPRLFVRISRTPAHSRTARTGPPAITPVPVAALPAAPPAPPATATASAASPTPASSPPTPARGPLLHRRRLAARMRRFGLFAHPRRARRRSRRRHDALLICRHQNSNPP